MEENSTDPMVDEISYTQKTLKRHKLVKKGAPKTPQQDALVNQIIKVKNKISFFKDLEDEDIRILIKDISFKKFNRNEFLFKQDQDDDGYVYYILKGSMKINITDKLGTTRTVTTIHDGNAIGEMQIVLQSKRSASCVVAEDGTILIGFTICEDTPEQSLLFCKFYKLIAKEMARKVLDTNSKVK